MDDNTRHNARISFMGFFIILKGYYVREIHASTGYLQGILYMIFKKNIILKH